MKITKRRMSVSITDNKQNLERHVIFQIVLFHVAGQDGISERLPGHLRPLAPAVHWQCVLVNILDGPGSSLPKSQRVSVCSLLHCFPARLLPLKPGNDSASLWMKVLLGICFQNTNVSSKVNLF